MDVDDPDAYAAGHPVQVLPVHDLGRGGGPDGKEGNCGQCQKRILQIYGRKIKFVPNVPHVPISSVIV